MAPSVRGSGARISKQQSTLRSFGKVAKASTLNALCKSKLEKAVVNTSIEAQQQSPTSNSKRKRNLDDEDSSDENKDAVQQQLSKKLRVQLPTPVSSAPTTDDEALISKKHRHIIAAKSCKTSQSRADLSESLHFLLCLHDFFLKAFSIHLAHNGQGTPANLYSLLETITKLFKKHAITLRDIQRVLAIYELDPSDHTTNPDVPHNKSPFRLVTSDVGTNSRISVEYAGENFRETYLQANYQSAIRSLYSRHCDLKNSFVHGSIESYPVLKCEVGTQTLARKEVASTMRQELLNLSSQSRNRAVPSLLNLSIKDNDEPQAPQALKNRTLSLFDRVKSKQLANSSASTPAAEAVLRHHAMGRIAEVVDILRMKQQQKQSSGLLAKDYANSIKIAGKVSFSLRSLIFELKSSMTVPMADDEIRLCVQILAKDVPGTWLNIVEVGSVKSVVLTGCGMSGLEVKKLLETPK